MARDKVTHQRRNIRARMEMLDGLLNSNVNRDYKKLLKDLNYSLQAKGEVSVSERTLKYDISYLINEHDAPIHRPTKSDPHIYYTKKFSLKDIPLNEEEVSLLRQAVTVLKKATDLSIITDIDAIISKLENQINTNVPDKTNFISFEEHTKALGQEHLDNLFDAIVNKCAIKVTYQPFGREAGEWVFSPYMLKEYRNRWYVIGRTSGTIFVSNLALDRIKKISNCKNVFEENELFDPETYFNNIIGVTFPQEKQLENIIIKVSKESADYILTKPIHKSQQLLKTYADGSIKVQLSLYINFELKAHLLSYGPKIEVFDPENLRISMAELYTKGKEIYIVST